MKRFSIIITLCIISSIVLDAQDFKGLSNPVTYEKIFALYGKPDSLDIRHAIDGLYATYEKYYYGDSYIEVGDHFIFCYDIYSDKFVLYDGLISKDGIKVGDRISTVLSSSVVDKVVKSEPPYIAYDVWFGGSDYPVTFSLDETWTFIREIYYNFIL